MTYFDKLLRFCLLCLLDFPRLFSFPLDICEVSVPVLCQLCSFALSFCFLWDLLALFLGILNLKLIEEVLSFIHQDLAIHGLISLLWFLNGFGSLSFLLETPKLVQQCMALLLRVVMLCTLSLLLLRLGPLKFLNFLWLDCYRLLLPISVADFSQAFASAEAAAERVWWAGGRVVVYRWVWDAEWAEYTIAVYSNQVIRVAILTSAAKVDGFWCLV